MKFGYFDDQNKEYVITTPQTPLPWINYLGSEDFFSLVSNTAGGYSFYRDARMRRLTRYRYNNSPLDMDGHRIYIKDGETVWNPGWQPTKSNVLVGLVLNVIAAYVIYRKPKASGIMMLFIIISLMFNGGTVPTYMVIRNLGMTGTVWSMILPDCTNAMFIILTLNAFKQVPKSTIEAAELDGAGHFTIMFRILLPQAMGLVTVTMINTAIISWNAWFNAMLYVPSDKNLWPLQLWIKQIVADNATLTTATSPDWNRYLVSYCVIIIATLPVLIAMPFAQKQLQKGSLMGAVKE